MTDNKRLLSLALIAFGAVFCLIYPLAIVWPSGWAWHEGNPASNNYYMMIVGVYATLGVFLIRAAGNPAAHASLIWFTVWSSLLLRRKHHQHLAAFHAGIGFDLGVFGRVFLHARAGSCPSAGAKARGRGTAG
jgi:hypothetical protein